MVRSRPVRTPRRHLRLIAAGVVVVGVGPRVTSILARRRQCLTALGVERVPSLRIVRLPTENPAYINKMLC